MLEIIKNIKENNKYCIIFKMLKPPLNNMKLKVFLFDF